jgi:hypothetical protein
VVAHEAEKDAAIGQAEEAWREDVDVAGLVLDDDAVAAPGLAAVARRHADQPPREEVGIAGALLKLLPHGEEAAVF